MTPLRILSYGLQAGLSMTEAMRSNPGAIITLFLWMRDYDDEQHGITRQRGDADFVEA